MKTLSMVLLTLLLASFSAPFVTAGNVEMAWGNCRAAGGSTIRTFACDANTGYNVILCTVTTARPSQQIVGLAGEIFLLADSPELPAWWQLVNPASCRPSALAAGFDFSSIESDSCYNLWSGPGSGTGGVAAYQTVMTFPPVPGGHANSARIRVGAAATTASPADSGQRYLCFSLRLSNTKTVGNDVCSGCSVPVCIRAATVRLYNQDGSVDVLTGSTSDSEVHWQEGEPGPCAWPRDLGMLWGRTRGLFR